MSELTFHPAALAYGPMSSADYQNLKASIKANGLINHIVLLGDEIVDGIHRYKACEELGVMAKFANLDTDKFPDVVEYIRSVNDARRHSTPKERTAAMQRVIETKPTASNAEVAASAGVSEPTARRARKAAGAKSAPAERTDAILAAIAADPQRSDRAIAKALGVNQSTVSRVRQSDANSSNDENASPQPAEKPKEISRVRKTVANSSNDENATPQPAEKPKEIGLWGCNTPQSKPAYAGPRESERKSKPEYPKGDGSHDALVPVALEKALKELLKVDPAKLTDAYEYVRAIRNLAEPFCFSYIMGKH